MKEFYRGPFLERGGMSADAIAEKLVRPPEYLLTPEQKTAVIGFENQLFDRQLTFEGLQGAHSESIGDVLRNYQAEETESPIFFAKPFLDGRMVEACEALVLSGKNRGHAIHVPVFESPRDVYTWIAQLAGEGGGNEEDRPVRSIDLLGLAKESLLAYKKELGAALVNDRAEDGEGTIDPLIAEGRMIALNPYLSLANFTKLQHVRNHLIAEHKSQRAYDSAVGEAHRAVLEIYLAKVNGQIANYLPRLGYILDQAKDLNNPLLSAKTRECTPVALRASLQDAGKRTKLFYRLDYLNNGIGFDDNGNATPVEGLLWRLAQRAPAGNYAGEATPRFTLEEKKKLEQYMLDSEEVIAIVSSVLKAHDRLSSEDPATYTPTRKVPARGGWQVVKHPTKDSFAVDSLPEVYKVPQSPISLYKLLTVGFAHEYRHVDQGEADKAIAKVLKIAQIKGRRVSMLREGGANAAQRATDWSLFGTVPAGRPLMTYARAIEALHTAGPVAAARAFYKALRERKPQQNKVVAGEEAADRIVRLMRNGGTNSQPLAYAEEYLLQAALEGTNDAVRKRAMAVTCFDLPDQLRLHRFGLLPSPRQKSALDVMDIALVACQEHIKKALAGDKQAAGTEKL